MFSVWLDPDRSVALGPCQYLMEDRLDTGSGGAGVGAGSVPGGVSLMWLRETGSSMRIPTAKQSPGTLRSRAGLLSAIKKNRRFRWQGKKGLKQVEGPACAPGSG